MATVSSPPPEPITTSSAHGSPPPAGTPSASGSRIHPLASLRRHPTAALIAAILSLLIGLAAAWKMGVPRYSATAVIYVSPRFIANLADNNSQKFDSMEQYREYVQQNVRTINRFDILIAALERLGPMKSVWVRPGETLERATARLQGALTIEAIPDTYQIAITLDGKTKAGLAELVNSVADTYLEKAKSEEFFDSDQRVQSLLADRARLQKEIADKQARRVALAQELGVSSFTDNDLNPYDQLLVTAKAAQSDAQKDAIQAETQLAVFDEKQHPGATEALHAFALSEANKDPVLSSIINNLNTRRAQVQASLSGLSADHPGRRAAERELAEIEKERQAATQAEVDSLSKMILEQRTAQAYQARRMEQQLAQEADRHSAQAAWFTHGYQEGIQLGLDVDEARKANDSIQQRIDYFMLEKNAPGFVRLFSAARVPDQPVKGGRKLFALLAFVVAMVMAVAMPVGIDFLDPRLHSPDQLESLLGFPATAWLMEKSEAGVDFEREQVLRFANRIVQDKQSNHSRTFAFTSVKSRGGTSTIVLETARALGSLGVSALAFEANGYSSDPRYSSSKSFGVAAILNGDRRLHTEVISSDGIFPDRIPVGNLPQGTNLPAIRSLETHLLDAGGDYDVVLVDAPPILASVDAEIIACQVDVVVLVIEAESVTRDELRRAAKSLERLKVRAISTLLNRVRLNEASGLAAVALQEFLTGAGAPSPRLLTPWLWR